ncbi:DUF1275 domain-containing protein [Synechocystis salina LEGE 06155]|nr:DUF1275 domain-containing protein [Synechocystis salina LEGE 06155]
MKLLSNEQFIVGVLFSWVAGFIDAASFLGLNGLFTSHITGNLVIAATEIIGVGGQALWVRLAVIPVFMFAVTLTTVLARRHQLKLSHLISMETLVLLLFTITAIILAPAHHKSANNLPLFLTGSLGVFSMGMQNALMRESLGHIAPTTAMTNNLTQFTMDLALISGLHRTLRPRATYQDLDACRTRLIKFGSALLGFSVGAIFGGVLTAKLGLSSLCLPLALMLWLSLRSELIFRHTDMNARLK